MRQRYFFPLLLSVLLAGCATTLDKLEVVGKQPPMSKVSDPTTKADYAPLTWPLPKEVPPGIQHANSLWQPGARAFFRDQRAGRVGDILRVRIKIKDKAELDNETDRSRSGTEALAAPKVLGAQRFLARTNGVNNLENLLDITGSSNSTGTGGMKREETIETQVAVLVTQVLPNGNLVIDGKQEIRINFEIREISVQGVIRPQDINSDNTIDSSQVAEARIVYGGRGQITDMQQPRWGTQVIDAVAPF